MYIYTHTNTHAHTQTHTHTHSHNRAHTNEANEIAQSAAAKQKSMKAFREALARKDADTAAATLANVKEEVRREILQVKAELAAAEVAEGEELEAPGAEEAETMAEAIEW